jgi:methylated-DNA-[protein]-cysteine S-methyltransferase
MTKPIKNCLKKEKYYYKKPMITLFQKKVYNIVKRIPKGRVLTYKEVAERLGNPKAYRAVGNALNKNHNPQIPCHRVIKSNGSIGGYNKGADKKKALLKKERYLE